MGSGNAVMTEGFERLKSLGANLATSALLLRRPKLYPGQWTPMSIHAGCAGTSASNGFRCIMLMPTEIAPLLLPLRSGLYSEQEETMQGFQFDLV